MRLTDDLRANKSLSFIATSFRLITASLRRARKNSCINFAALFFKHAGGNFNAMIQKIGIANSKVRFNRSGSFIARAINQSSYSRLNQRARAHHARFNRGINNRVRQPIVTRLCAAASRSATISACAVGS